MTVESTMENGVIVINPIGRLDSPAAPDFEKATDEALSNSENFESIIFDLSEVDFISSKGLRVLVAVHREHKDKKIEIIGVNKSVYEVLKQSGLLSIFNVKEA